jgi:8-oxo-dGTP diphosphatase
MRRELREELDIQVEAHDMRVIHIAHTIAPDRVYFNTYIEIDSYEGTITNMEPTKCSEIQFFDIDTIRDDPRFAYEIETLSHIMQGIPFSEKII